MKFKNLDEIGSENLLNSAGFVAIGAGGVFLGLLLVFYG